MRGREREREGMRGRERKKSKGSTNGMIDVISERVEASGREMEKNNRNNYMYAVHV